MLGASSSDKVMVPDTDIDVSYGPKAMVFFS